MTLPRRRILRPASASITAAKVHRLREQLAEENVLARWMMRLRRAFHAVEKHQRRIARMQRSLLAQEASQ